MSRAYEIALRAELLDFISIYVATYSHSYLKFDPSQPGYGQSLVAYKKTVLDNAESICRAAAAGIGTYLYDYDIRPNESVDEYKHIYFIGLAIHSQLKARALHHAARVHLVSMIGLLDYRLKSLGYDKPQLRKAMVKLIRHDKFETDLGAIGCYLIFKCVSTAERTGKPVTAAL